MDIPGAREGELWNKGVSACAVCEGASPLFRNKEVVVVGGGDTAIEEALFLTKYASKVYIVHRRDRFRASQIMQERALRHPQIDVLFDSEVIEVLGHDCVEAVRIARVGRNEVYERKVSGLFFAIGHTPNTSFLKGQVDCDEAGYIKVDPCTGRTSIAGIWAAGDVQDPRCRQAITAAGSGCVAAMDLIRSLE